jgi:ABC-type antimicrobial peptide transport system permease subunit
VSGPWATSSDEAVAPRRLQTLLAGAFATVGILLACLGVFGMVSYDVARRTNEIGVRMALGAIRPAVVSMVVGEALRPVLFGLLGGLAAAQAASRMAASLLYGVSAHDPVVPSVVACVIVAAALVAAYWPARRAAAVEPVRALRWE